MTGAEPMAPLAPATRDALAELLLTLADDEFVLGFWDSEWTGIAPMLEEDVAFSSLAQDEIGHARAFYELLATLTGTTADAIAYGRPPAEYRHARLLDHGRGDWAFSIGRRYLYETADAVRLEALEHCSYAPLRELVAKVRREERYHLMHLDAWLKRLAEPGTRGRERLVAALDEVWPDAPAVLAPLAGEAALLESGMLAEPMAVLRDRWMAQVRSVFEPLDLPVGAADDLGDRSSGGGGEFGWLWNEFTSVSRSEEGATW